MSQHASDEKLVTLVKAAASIASNWRTEEVRIAMALNGGVSLAVWMGGCAVELDCARRAHLGPETLSDDETDPIRSVYSALCLAFDRQLVVDLMSGASAGGINGALLAAAIRSNTRLHPDFLRGRWLELGDFSNLLQKTGNAEPRSLMQGNLFYDAVRDTFRAVLGHPDATGANLTALPPGHGSLKPIPASLVVTTTDVLGKERRFIDFWKQPLVAREYRGRFKFREAEDFTAESLAQASRASASFPLAFEPWRVTGPAGSLANFDYPRYCIDGGLLDNAPIRAVLELIPERPAARQVQRFVCYVNADPPLPEAQPVLDPMEPPIPDVVGYIVNLPRNAPYADQLDAIENAVRRGIFANDIEQALLVLNLPALIATAERLLLPYRGRRRLISLEELLGDPAAARTAFEVLPDDAELPWVPQDLNAPDSAADWSWGVRAAERVLHLVLDLIRRVLQSAGAQANRAGLLEARDEIDSLLDNLRVLRHGLMENQLILGGVQRLVTETDVSAELAALDAAMADYDGPSFEGVKRAAEVAFSVSAQLGELEPEHAVGEALFGPSWLESSALTDNCLTCFLQRVLAIEVVRRAFYTEEAIDAGEALHFAQLTPFASSPIFSAQPLTDEGPNRPEEKLTGIELGHFAAFYRRSWRANDFMWGRLDAAGRIVEMLVSPERAQWLLKSEVELSPPWVVLAQELTDQPTAVGLWLLHEALVDAKAAGSAAVQAALAGYDLAEPPSAEELQPVLQAALEADLSEGGTGAFTRLVSTRAAQLEIVRQELPLVEKESRRDQAAGTMSKPLELPSTGGSRAMIEEVREQRSAGRSLPMLLGRSRSELASNMAIRTFTHAVFVALAALRAAKLPLAQLLGVVRGPLLPAAGITSRNPLNWLGVIVGFSASVSYLAARVLTTSRDKDEDATLSSLFSLPAAVAGLAVLVIAGVVFVPLFRAWRGNTGWRRVRDFLLGGGLALGGVAALVLGLWKLRIGWAELVGAPGAVRPSAEISLLALGAVLGIPIFRGVGLWRAAQRKLNALFLKPWGGYLSLAVIAAASIAILWKTAPEVWDAGFNGSRWETVIAAAAAFSAGLCAFAFIPRAAFTVLQHIPKK